MAIQKNFQFSPSLHHQNLMKQTKQTLAYKNQDVKVWQQKLKRKLRELIGEMPSKSVPLNIQTLWKREHPLGTIEKIVFTSEPYADVPAFLCLPKNGNPPYTTFICVQGHNTGMHNSIRVDRDDNTQTIDVPGDRDFGLLCLERGLAALCIEQRSFGERRELDQKKPARHGCQDATMQSLMLGRTLIGERVYDVDRGLDFLNTRVDIAIDRIGIMGNSGGGTISLFAAALLPRIRYAMPSCYFCTFKDSIMSIGHCVCNYIPRLHRYAEMPDVLGLFAPKPVVLVAGKEDDIFPIAGVRRAFRKLKTIYAAAGAPNRCHLVIGEEGHRFYAREAWPKMLQEISRI